MILTDNFYENLLNKNSHFFCDLTVSKTVIRLSIGWPRVLGLGNFAQSLKIK